MRRPKLIHALLPLALIAISSSTLSQTEGSIRIDEFHSLSVDEKAERIADVVRNYTDALTSKDSNLETVAFCLLRQTSYAPDAPLSQRHILKTLAEARPTQTVRGVVVDALKRIAKTHCRAELRNVAGVSIQEYHGLSPGTQDGLIMRAAKEYADALSAKDPQLYEAAICILRQLGEPPNAIQNHHYLDKRLAEAQKWTPDSGHGDK